MSLPSETRPLPAGCDGSHTQDGGGPTTRSRPAHHPRERGPPYAPGGNPLSWISLGIALVALVLNGRTFRDHRRQDRRDLFLELHERPIDPDVQRGRRLLYERVLSPADAARLREDPTDDYELVNRVLAMFEVFVMHVERGYVDRGMALEEWGHTIARAYERAEHFLDDREQLQTRKPWPNLRMFGPVALAWHAQQAG